MKLEKINRGLMVGKSKAISEEMVAACKKETWNKRGDRKKAAISAKKYGISQVSKIYNPSRETLMRWIRKFKQGGSEAFKVQPGRGIKPKLNKEQQEKIIADQPNSQEAKIDEIFSIRISESTALRLMKKLDFSYMSSAP